MDLMKTVTESTQKSKSAKDQLHELNEQKKLDLENSLLKEALVESSEKCEKLLRELKDLQEKKTEQDHQTIEEIRKNIEQYRTSSEILEQEIEKEIGTLCDDVQRETVNKVGLIWRDYQMRIEQTFASIIRTEEEINRRLKQQVKEVEQARQRLFRFDGLKTGLFWIGMVANIVTCVMLILEKIIH